MLKSESAVPKSEAAVLNSGSGVPKSETSVLKSACAVLKSDGKMFFFERRAVGSPGAVLDPDALLQRRLRFCAGAVASSAEPGRPAAKSARLLSGDAVRAAGPSDVALRLDDFF